MSETGGNPQSGTGTDTAQKSGGGLQVTRRDFLIGAGAGAATAGVVLGGAVVVKNVVSPDSSTATKTNTTGPIPATMRRVTLNIDGVDHDLVVDNRDSLWETMNVQLGLSNSNLGCDRAQCGACAVLVDGKAMNSCTLQSARLGRGQKITTVAGLATGSGVAGLHPVQRAFWLDGGFQCGICTRGFIMSTVALLAATPKPTTAQIAEGLAGNICRCGEYSKIYRAVNTASQEMSGQKVTYLSAPVVVEVQKPAGTTGNIQTASKDFSFNTPFATIEEFDPFAQSFKTKPGIVDVSGNERSITVKWDSSKLTEQQVRDLLAAAGHGVK